MDSTLSPSTPQMALSTSSLSHFPSTLPFNRTLKSFPTSASLASSVSFTSSPRSFCAISPAIRRRFRCVSAPAASGDANSDGADEVSAISPDVVVLDVGGMMCEGCADSVKRLLESRVGQRATVWPVPETKTESNWQKQLGGALAEHLTNCGFKSSPQVRKISNWAFGLVIPACPTELPLFKMSLECLNKRP
ncbi:copper-transporting ATPase PAA1, chloroplastic-like [Senna tora]|uniref:Copper-transporting ATPase PAA1, chloroplastic-like n=1 Tax=Senna tora TaxID=362788 RepID=A0A834XCY3_9FABA|nr:copper-transporting ATPase PAA1, chloroplastic-like [Senna tora]